MCCFRCKFDRCITTGLSTQRPRQTQWRGTQQLWQSACWQLQVSQAGQTPAEARHSSVFVSGQTASLVCVRRGVVSVCVCLCWQLRLHHTSCETAILHVVQQRQCQVAPAAQPACFYGSPTTTLTGHPWVNLCPCHARSVWRSSSPWTARAELPDVRQGQGQGSSTSAGVPERLWASLANVLRQPWPECHVSRVPGTHSAHTSPVDDRSLSLVGCANGHSVLALSTRNHRSQSVLNTAGCCLRNNCAGGGCCPGVCRFPELCCSAAGEFTNNAR